MDLNAVFLHVSATIIGIMDSHFTISPMHKVMPNDSLESKSCRQYLDYERSNVGAQKLFEMFVGGRKTVSDNFSNLVLFVQNSFNISTLIAMLLVTLVDVGYIDT